MSTKIMKATEFTNAQENVSAHRLLHRVGRFFVVAVLLLASLLATVPVILLFFVTSVPLLIALGLAALDLGIVMALVRMERTLPVITGAAAGLIVVSMLAVYASQVFATTPAISTPGGISTLEKVELGGSEQWITIRGRDAENPVLLFLAGGPGGSELAMTRKYLGELEEHFVVVNWDQPGTGKSYHAVALDALTPQRYVSDAHELTLYLIERFQQEKIYVFGESWGSILGILLVQAYPDLFHAFISTGQMVDVVENDIMMYEFAIARLSEQGNLGAVEELRRNGAPPYTSDTLLGSFMAMNDVVNRYMNAHAYGEGTHHNLLFDSLLAPEYGLLDKVNWVRGLMDTFVAVYPQVYDVDFRTQATRLDVPAYFIKGRWDVNASNALLEEYFAILEAPHKELIWFEESAHTPMWDEPAHFIDILVNRVLAQKIMSAPKAAFY